MKDLDLRFIFAHSDEQVYAKLAHILWKSPDLYKNIVIGMGGFRQLRVRQLIIFKRYVCKGFRKWFIDADIIAEGSADMALEERHYYRNMRLLKESFSALVQYRVENFTNNYKNLGEEFQLRLENISNEASIDEVISCNEFNDIYNNIVQTYGTESVTTVSYLHDVSSLLALVRSVRESDFELHMQAERDMLKYCFAFDHVNYARYLLRTVK